MASGTFRAVRGMYSARDAHSRTQAHAINAQSDDTKHFVIQGVLKEFPVGLPVEEVARLCKMNLHQVGYALRSHLYKYGKAHCVNGKWYPGREPGRTM